MDVINPATSASLAAAKQLWIDIQYVVPNRGVGQEGNQIDMQRGSRVFFGFGDGALPRNSPIGSIIVSYKGNSALRNLRFGNNSMDKLDLPIPVVEGPSTYSGKTLLFTKLESGAFQLDVGTQKDILSWKKQSKATGSLFTMKSGREFGVF